MTVSIVLPTFNEAGNIVRLVSEIHRALDGRCALEIIVVDDNSPDGTYQLVRDTFADDRAVKAILRTTDRGFAKSIRRGIEAATGEYVVVMDTDLTHDPAEIPRLLHIAEIYDIASGSRFCAGGNMQDTAHYLASLLYNWYIRVLLRTQVQDNLGGFFAMKRSRLFELPFDMIFYGYGEYFIRLLYYAQRRGFSLVEIPATYQARTAGRSKSNFVKMLFTYSRAAVDLRVASWRVR